MPLLPTDDETLWRGALDLYNRDLVTEAFELVRNTSIGPLGAYLRMYRILEAEAMTRSRSTTIKIGPQIDLEIIAEEVGEALLSIIDVILGSIENVSQRLRWQSAGNQQTLVSFMSEESDAPWTQNPYGYFVPKANLGKICLPPYLIHDQISLGQAVSHEFAHVITAELSGNRAPKWVNEVVSVQIERSVSQASVQRFRAGSARWLNVRDLESVLSQGVLRPQKIFAPLKALGSRAGTDDSQSSTNAQRVLDAYEQCGLIGRYLCSISAEAKLGDLLRAHQTSHGMLSAILGRSITDSALRYVYELTETELFDRAKESLYPAENA